jgi:hypothetical protein
MCVPSTDRAELLENHPLSQALADFNATRLEVVAEVYRYKTQSEELGVRVGLFVSVVVVGLG